MSANAETQAPQQPANKKGKRKRALILLTLLFVIIGVAYGSYWFLVLRHFEETDDAYVAGNQVQIMSQVSGSVTKVWADNTDFVKEGDVLVTLDPTDARQAFEKAKTALASSVRQTHQLMINSKQLQANIEVQKIALAKAQSDYNRRVPLGNANLIGREELQHARDAVTSAQAQLDVAIQQYNANQAMILGTKLESNVGILNCIMTGNYLLSVRLPLCCYRDINVSTTRRSFLPDLAKYPALLQFPRRWRYVNLANRPYISTTFADVLARRLQWFPGNWYF